MDSGQFLKRWSDFAATKRGRRLIRTLRVVFLAVVVFALAYQLSRIGWADLLRALPVQPAFYGFVLAMYFLLPLMESVVYGRLWEVPASQCFWVMIRKRVLNMDMLDYSGEVYLFLWAKDHVAKPPETVMGGIKDNLIVSSASSLWTALLLIGGLLLFGRIALDEVVEIPNPVYVGVAGMVVVLIGLVVYRFRRVIFSLSRRALAALAGVHVLRIVVGYVLQVAAWWVVLPTVSLEAWAMLLVVFVVIHRISLLPSRDLVFVTVGAGITPLMDVPVAPVVGMLLVRSTVDRLLNLVFFLSSGLVGAWSGGDQRAGRRRRVGGNPAGGSAGRE